MSTMRWFRSRSGLVSCPSCAAHVRYGRETDACPFCAARLGPSRPTRPRQLGARGSLLAASLVALGAFGVVESAWADEPSGVEPTEAPAEPTPAEASGDEAPDEADFGVAQPIYGTVSTPYDDETAESDGPSWTITVDPLTTALGFVHVQVEYALAERWSIYAGPHLRLFSSPLTAEDDVVDDLEGYGAELGVRYFLWGDAPEGLWMMMRGVGGFGTTGDADGFVGYLSHLVGYTWIWDDWLVLAGGGGIQYLTYNVDGQGPDRGMAPALHTNIGIAF